MTSSSFVHRMIERFRSWENNVLCRMAASPQPPLSSHIALTHMQSIAAPYPRQTRRILEERGGSVWHISTFDLLLVRETQRCISSIQHHKSLVICHLRDLPVPVKLPAEGFSDGLLVAEESSQREWNALDLMSVLCYTPPPPTPKTNYYLNIPKL